MDDIMMARLILMTERINPILFVKVIEAASANKCKICENIPKNKKLIECVFCEKEFCLSCSGKENTRICCRCNFIIATTIDKDILKRFSIKELRILTNNYNMDVIGIYEKDEMIDAILNSFKKSIKRNDSIVNVNKLKQKMIEMKINETRDKERSVEEEKIQSKIFSDYSNVGCEHKQLPVNFCTSDSIDITLDDIPKLPNKDIKELLDRFKIDYHDIVEKKELVSLAISLLQAFNRYRQQNDEIGSPIKKELECNICMNALINCVFIDCGHSMCCHGCGIALEKCPICRKDILKCFKIVIG